MFLEKLLTFKVKTIELVKWKKKSVWSNQQEFVYDTLDGMPVLVTHQGFAPWLEKEMRDKGLDVRVENCCVPDLLPPPRLDKMRGFRFSQKKVVTELLLANRSGRLGLPTRYGKTFCLINILRAYPGVKTVVLAPGQDLLVQLTADLKAALEPEGREIKQIGGGSTVKFMSEDITVCSMDSTHKLDKESVRLVIGDEIHTMASATRQDILLDFPLCRKIGMTASQTGRFDKKDFMIEGLFGPLLAHIPYKEAVIEKAVEQITVLAMDWPVEIANAGMARTTDRDAAMKLVFQGEKLGRCVRWLAHTVLPPNWQTLFFIKTEEQADALLNYIGSETAIAMAKKLSKKERNAMTEKVRHNHISRVICSDIFVQGVTFHDVVCLVNCAGGGASTTTIQKPGRLAEIRPNKSGSLLVDFDIRPGNAVAMECQGVLQLWRETQARLASYRDTGYHVVQVKPAMFLRTLIALGISFDGVTPRLPE